MIVDRVQRKPSPVFLPFLEDRLFIAVLIIVVGGFNAEYQSSHNSTLAMAERIMT